MQTIYVIESGSYSDYGVHHAYTTREAAEAACEIYNRTVTHAIDAFDVLELDLHDEPPQPVEGLRLVGNVSRDGTTVAPSERTDLHTNHGGSQQIDKRIWPNSRGWQVVVVGDDHERVRKVYADTVAQLRAEALEL